MTTPSVTLTSGGTTSAEHLVREAHDVLDRCGIVRSPSWVERTVRRFTSSALAGGVPFAMYLATRVELSAEERARAEQYVLDYADPTGETATRHVDRERGWR